MEFKDLKLVAPLLKALQQQEYKHPTPVQQQAIPVALSNKDLLACAQTGTGKTAAFALPILQLLFNDKKNGNASTHISALILTPTRELAIQIEESFKSYGAYTGLKSFAVYGGISQYHQVKKLRQGVDILIATPGRLLDLATQRLITLQHIKTLVLDEADRMLDMGFINDVRKILARLPQQKQTLFFSATMPPDIIHLSQSILDNPVSINITPASTTAETVEQAVYFVEKSDKRSLLIHLLKNDSIDTALVFTETKFGADKLCAALRRENIRVQAIHGDKTQAERQKALNNFKNKHISVLIATDIAARGIDIESLPYVINYELPNIPETYVHRIGRTGRAGINGKAISFCGMEEKMLLRDIHKLIDRSIPVIKDHPFQMAEADASMQPKTVMPFRSLNRRRDKTFRQR
ncbi:DEAD/DEAH box helicase [Parafilimonas terrae]|uniref:DEAD-box ATP-dependent RNA helicase RhpA n=1 Tax=Parafilimonas terrae TaxID=1465490 RepID=A0A1I5VVW2_9BACT|nr:DEAD/DEAH box helicase [Parafilimonas terrae]SFQ11724.1 ATP-dependent RNA helicase RhlE [Parafilimonas terrae]